MFWQEIVSFICAHEPTKLHRFMLDAGEIFILVFLLVALGKLVGEIHKIRQKIKEHHPDDK